MLLLHYCKYIGKMKDLRIDLDIFRSSFSGEKIGKCI